MGSHDHHHDDDHHDGHQHGHGHDNDQGLGAMARYLRHAPRMWSSAINDAVIELADPTSGERCVDIGAGMGAGTMPAARRGAAVVAVEPTPFMRRILLARSRFGRHRSRITVADGAAEKIPAADGSVDVVWAVNTMHHWLDPDAGAAEIARVLKPAGRVVLVDEDFANPEHPDHEKWGQRHGHDDDEHDHHGFTMVDAAEMGGRLERQGLTGVDAAERQLAGRPVIAILVNVTRPG